MSSNPDSSSAYPVVCMTTIMSALYCGEGNCSRKEYFTSDAGATIFSTCIDMSTLRVLSIKSINNCTQQKVPISWVFPTVVKFMPRWFARQRAGTPFQRKDVDDV